MSSSQAPASATEQGAGVPLLTTSAGAVSKKNSILPLWLIYIIPGALILVNYVVCVVYLMNHYGANDANPDQRGGFNLWGSIYDKKYTWLYALYQIGFLVAASGFIMNMYYVFTVASLIPTNLYSKLCSAMAVFMVFEHLWMPACCLYIGDPKNRDWLWWFIFVELKICALAIIAVAVCTTLIPPELAEYASWKGGEETKTSENGGGRTKRTVGVVGSWMIAAHCTLLDGIMWPFFFNDDGRFSTIKRLDPNY
ncbi:unnamed protein product [Amoebophrya sp. A25]|nr:unnamed protein product [Amoebophrya sp. A25]|eukprot:GSA25T00019969001.1